MQRTGLLDFEFGNGQVERAPGLAAGFGDAAGQRSGLDLLAVDSNVFDDSEARGGDQEADGAGIHFDAAGGALDAQRALGLLLMDVVAIDDGEALLGSARKIAAEIQIQPLYGAVRPGGHGARLRGYGRAGGIEHGGVLRRTQFAARYGQAAAHRPAACGGIDGGASGHLDAPFFGGSARRRRRILARGAEEPVGGTGIVCRKDADVVEVSRARRDRIAVAGVNPEFDLAGGGFEHAQLRFFAARVTLPDFSVTRNGYGAPRVVEDHAVGARMQMRAEVQGLIRVGRPVGQNGVGFQHRAVGPVDLVGTVLEFGAPVHALFFRLGNAVEIDQDERPLAVAVAIFFGNSAGVHDVEVRFDHQAAAVARIDLGDQRAGLVGIDFARAELEVGQAELAVAIGADARAHLRGARLGREDAMEGLPVGSAGGRACGKRRRGGNLAAGGVIGRELGECARVQIDADAQVDFEIVAGVHRIGFGGLEGEFILGGGDDFPGVLWFARDLDLGRCGRAPGDSGRGLQQEQSKRKHETDMIAHFGGAEIQPSAIGNAGSFMADL